MYPRRLLVPFSPPTARDWTASWATQQLGSNVPLTQDVFDPILSQHLKRVNDKKALEVGCFPGGFLRYLSERFGYEVSGVDYVPDTVAVAEKLRRSGAQVGSITHGDFLTTPAEPIYDLVCSFGFLEHFPDPEAILARHVEWLKPGGTLIVSVPHFRFLQYVFHALFDRRSMRLHNTEVMSTTFFRRQFDALNIDVLSVELFGGAYAWREADPERGAVNTWAGNQAQRAMGLIDRKMGRGGRTRVSRLTSPFLVAIGQRPEQ
jgi:2-polyprenyl-3-methyl-5-hydroxy-6-metoxy-1,4-benzoquinol methylase